LQELLENELIQSLLAKLVPDNFVTTPSYHKPITTHSNHKLVTTPGFQNAVTTPGYQKQDEISHFGEYFDYNVEIKPKVCAQDKEIWNDCASSCEITCDNHLQLPKFCSKECVPRCECTGLTVRYPRDGTCIYQGRCPLPWGKYLNCQGSNC
jgi:hypothetical protein